jgi:hydroxymethylpyrimidine pyrophosphatase-like HAD family hydrolase
VPPFDGRSVSFHNKVGGTCERERVVNVLSFKMLACDYDRTIATDGVVSLRTIRALTQAKATGLVLGLVTGRELDDLLEICPDAGLFDLIVAENGAVLFSPGRQELNEVAGRPGREFFEELRNRAIPFSTGRVIVATSKAYETAVLSVIWDLGLELEVIANRDSVMVLPPGINKATGLAAGIETLGITFDQVIAIGDAENDAVLLQASGLSVAVANALESIKGDADIVTTLPEGDGVTEFIEDWLLRSRESREGRD